MSLVLLGKQTLHNFVCTITENRNSFQGRDNVEKSHYSRTSVSEVEERRLAERTTPWLHRSTHHPA